MFKILGNKKTQKKIWIILAVVIVPAFVLWGSSSVMRSQKPTSVSPKRILGKNVSAEEFDNALEATRNTLIMQYGESYFQMQQLLKQSIENMAIVRLALLKEAQRRKIRIPDEEVITFIQNLPFFQNKGRFDPQAYSYTISYLFRTQPRIFEEQMRQNLMLGKLTEEVTKDITVTDKQIHDEYEEQNEQISICYIAGLFADFEKDIAVSQEEMKEYFTQHSIEFKQPLSYNIEYVLIDTQEKTDGFKQRINKKEDFTQIAKDLSLALKETGLFTQIDPIPGIGWNDKLTRAITNLKVGQVSEPLEADKKYYVIRLKERKEPYIPEFEQVIEKVKETIIKKRSRQLAKEKIDSCLKQLQETAKNKPGTINFEDIAKETGLKSAVTGSFTNGSYIENIGASDNFFTAARKLKADEFSQIINMPSGYFIVKLNSRTPIDENKFKAEKEEFGKKLLRQKKEEYFGKFTQDLTKKALQ